MTDVNPHRLELARRMGAVIELGEADALIECSGHPLALRDGIAAVRPAGTAVLVGMGSIPRVGRDCAGRVAGSTARSRDRSSAGPGCPSPGLCPKVACPGKAGTNDAPAKPGLRCLPSIAREPKVH